jgi:hypothetical protein
MIEIIAKIYCDQPNNHDEIKLKEVFDKIKLKYISKGGWDYIQSGLFLHKNERFMYHYFVCVSPAITTWINYEVQMKSFLFDAHIYLENIKCKHFIEYK